MKYEIEKGIKIESTHTKKRRAWEQYPLLEMVVGDSFLMQSDDLEKSARLRSKIISAIGVFKRTVNPNRQFTTRIMKNGVRIWRVL